MFTKRQIQVGKLVVKQCSGVCWAVVRGPEEMEEADAHCKPECYVTPRLRCELVEKSGEHQTAVLAVAIHSSVPQFRRVYLDSGFMSAKRIKKLTDL